MANPQQKSNREHSFDSELASLVGIEKAILLKNISYWVDENERKKIESSFAYGKWWTFESLTSLAKKYPYMKRGNLSRWFKELKQDKWILMFNTTDGANMYTPGPVFNSWNLGQDWQGVFQNETGREWGEVFQNETKGAAQNETKGAAQNETKGAAQNETKGAAQNETHNNVEKDIENNVELEGEREAEKTAPTPTSYDEMIARVEDEANALEAKKEKSPLVAGVPPKLTPEQIADLQSDARKFDPVAPLLVQSFDAQTAPGAMIRTAEILEPNANQITIKTGMNSAGETYIFEHTERVASPTPAARILNGVNRAPMAEDSDGAQKLIMSWAANGALETVQNWYSLARRKFTPEDLELITAKFCGTYSTIADAGRRSLFFSDPVQFFRNKGRVFIQDQKSFERMNEPKNGFAQPETKSNLPKSIRHF